MKKRKKEYTKRMTIAVTPALFKELTIAAANAGAKYTNLARDFIECGLKGMK